MALAACTGGGAPVTQAPGGAPDGGGSSATLEAATPAAEPGGGSAANVCAMLTPGEIEQVLQVPMKDGVPDDLGDSSAALCTWESQDPMKGGAVILTIEPFDATSWEVYTDLGTAELPSEQLPGIGDEAIRVGGTILGGLVAVRKGSTTAELQVLGVFLDQAVVEAAREPLARIVASRM